MFKRICLFMCAAVLLLPTVVSAHEFIVKPVQLNAKSGMPVPFSVISAHVFMISEEMEAPNTVETSLITAKGTEPVKLTPNETRMTLDGRINMPEECSILAGHRKPVVWTQTTKGWKQASKKGLKGVIQSGKYEKFSKTLLFPKGASSKGFDKVVGQKLEIIPMNDPSELNVGDYLEVKVLLDGKPTTVENITATYDCFTDLPNTYAYYTAPYGKGLAKVKISHKGVWMVRTQYVNDQATEDYDKHVLRSVLIFEVK